MSGYFLKSFYLLLLLSLLASGISVTLKNSSESGEAKCIERERQALLNFRVGLKDPGMLSTWTSHHNNADRCKWKRIHCNHQTGHVQLLDLRGTTHYTQLRGAINVTSAAIMILLGLTSQTSWTFLRLVSGRKTSCHG
ncbi:receptor-like protein EIX2 [Vigna unguiculata]|uniref:receptor-like protein EIX2 n=1 Tax=Vigna unguiculata TaxID=3917 RepID=UPI001016B9D0|nr:receptor-like protein EIX2 [Vigna unguiculata]